MPNLMPRKRLGSLSTSWCLTGMFAESAMACVKSLAGGGEAGDGEEGEEDANGGVPRDV